VHSGGKDGGGQKEKQMHNNETAEKNITKIQFTYFTHISLKISESSNN